MPIIIPHPLHNPPFLNIQVLPAEVKLAVAERLNHQKNVLKEVTLERRPKEDVAIYHKGIDAIIDKYVNFMKQRDQSEHFEKFWTHTRRLDRIRGENFSETFPEFYKILEPYVRDIHVG